MNPIKEPFIKLLGRLNTLNGILHFLDKRIREVQERVQHRLAQPSTEKRLPMFMSGASLPITDLDQTPPVSYASGGYALRDHQFLVGLTEILNRFAAQTISQGFEAFETFLYDIVATYLHVHQTKVDVVKVSKFDNKRRAGAKTDWNYWRSFAKYSYPQNKEILQLLRSLALARTTTESSNWRGMNLPEWYEVTEEVRHAITHSDFTIKQDRIAKWTSVKKELLNHWYPSVVNGTERRLSLDQRSTERALSLLSEYALIFFKHLSLAEGYPWNLFEQPI